MFQTYSRLLTKYPFSVQVATGGILWFSGDVLSQLATRKHDKLDLDRCKNMTIYGVFIASPIYYLWYKNLDLFVSKSIHSSFL